MCRHELEEKNKTDRTDAGAGGRPGGKGSVLGSIGGGSRADRRSDRNDVVDEPIAGGEDVVDLAVAEDLRDPDGEGVAPVGDDREEPDE